MKDYSEDVKIFRAFSDERRLDIITQLKSGEKCACVLMEKTNMAQSRLSYHMKILCESNIVNSRIDGKWTYYSLSKSGIEFASKRMKEITKID